MVTAGRGTRVLAALLAAGLCPVAAGEARAEGRWALVARAGHTVAQYPFFVQSQGWESFDPRPSGDITVAYRLRSGLDLQARVGRIRFGNHEEVFRFTPTTIRSVFDTQLDAVPISFGVRFWPRTLTGHGLSRAEPFLETAVSAYRMHWTVDWYWFDTIPARDQVFSGLDYRDVSWGAMFGGGVELFPRGTLALELGVNVLISSDQTDVVPDLPLTLEGMFEAVFSAGFRLRL